VVEKVEEKVEKVEEPADVVEKVEEPADVVSVRKCKEYELPADIVKLPARAIVKWLLDQCFGLEIVGIFDFFGFELLGQVSSRGTMESTLAVGRSVVAGLASTEVTSGHGDKIFLQVQKRKTGAGHRLDICCKYHTIEAGGSLQIGSQVFFPNGDGTFNQFDFLRVLFCWRCIITALSARSERKFPLFCDVASLCRDVKDHVVQEASIRFA
jgi:hypothetical protein